MARLINSTEEFANLTDEMLKKIDNAIVAVAFRLRDEARAAFRRGVSNYKYHNSTNHSYSDLAEGIMIGKLNNSTIKVHAMGSKSDYDSYKTRFFVGGTKYRTQRQVLGKNIKPFSKGRITANSAIDEACSNANNLLSTYIKNVIN